MARHDSKDHSQGMSEAFWGSFAWFALRLAIGAGLMLWLAGLAEARVLPSAGVTP